MHAALARHRSAAVSFLSLTSWSRPSFTPTRTVNFSTLGGLTTALSGMQDGDLIQYNGTGVATFTGSGTETLTIASKNPANGVVIDFGTKTSVWGAPTSGNYVKFVNTNASQGYCVFMHDCSNLTLYGGEYTGGSHTYTGILCENALTNVTFWDFVVHDIGGGGISMLPTSNNTMSGCSIRGEVYNFAMNPGIDVHSDKGSGIHACLVWDTTGGSWNSNTVAIYGHDSLQAGATSYGTVWPEGGGGSVIQFGQSGSTGTGNSNALYAKGVNMGMKPGFGGGNPGSTSAQTGGNIFNLWGGVALNSDVIGWAEGSNCTGAVIDAAGGVWKNGSPAVVVNHGRSNGSCLGYTGGGNQSVNYPTGFNITYNDCT